MTDPNPFAPPPPDATGHEGTPPPAAPPASPPPAAQPAPYPYPASPYSPTAGAPVTPPMPAAAGPVYPPQQPGYGPPTPPGGYGYAPGYPPYPVATPAVSGRAVAVLVLGIASLVGLCMYGLTVVCAIVALALAPGANREIRASNGWKTGEGMVKAGVICSWICIALAVVGILAIVALFVVAANDPSFASSSFGA